MNAGAVGIVPRRPGIDADAIGIVPRRPGMNAGAVRIVPMRPGKNADAVALISSANAFELAAWTIVGSAPNIGRFPAAAFFSRPGGFSQAASTRFARRT
jgi:hypothetical protein